MKYSIDINNTSKTISGWAASEIGLDIEDGVVILQHIGETIEKIRLSTQRDDVKNAKLHHNGKCGFVFRDSTNTPLYDRIHDVVIKSTTEKIKKTVFIGDVDSKIKEFSEFEIDRDDFSIMDEPTDSLKSSNGDLLLTKKLLIRLRRAKRAKNFRGKFIGIEHKHKETDWSLFDKIIRTYQDFLLSKIETRYLWSFIDTYADFGSPKERIAALAISNYLYQERFAQTIHCIYELKKKEKPQKDIQLRYWDGMGTNLLKADDSYDIFLTRNLEILSETPLMKNFFKEFIRRSITHSDSITRINTDNSDHFKGTLSFYIDNLITL